MSFRAPAPVTPTEAHTPGTAGDTKWYGFFTPASLVLLLDLCDTISTGPLTPVPVTLLIALTAAPLTTGFHLRIGGLPMDVGTRTRANG